MTTTHDTSESLARAAALAALTAGQPTEATPVPVLERTGRTVDVGGTNARLLVQRASTLGHRIGGVYHRCGAVPGDVVLLSAGEADRLDALGVTVSPDEDTDEVTALTAAGLLTDDQVLTGRAEDLVAYVTQHPDERARVRALEESRSGRRGQPRATVLAATEPTPVEDDEALAVAAAIAAGLEAATSTGPTAQEVAAANQGDDLAGKAE